jgi:hypothetical protein
MPLTTYKTAQQLLPSEIANLSKTRENVEI